MNKFCDYCKTEKDISLFPARGRRCKRCAADAAKQKRASLDFRETPVSPEQRTLKGMVQRCHNPNSGGYPRYGGRGISVCDRWRESSHNFIEDMGPKPGPGYSIERNDNNGNYEPDNCRWATRTEQNRNTSRNVFVEHNGKQITISELSSLTGIHVETIRSRVKNTSEEGSLTRSVRKANKYTYKGNEYTLEELATISEFSYQGLYKRIVLRGMSVEEAVDTPRGR